MSKKMLVALYLALGILIAPRNSGSQELTWKGSVEEKDGVRIVHNPSTPLYGEIKLELREDLSLGKEGSPQEMFYRVRGLAVDSHGSIYVADMSNQRIQVFESNGKYLRTVGRMGQGPGEFQQPWKVLIAGDSEDLFVLDGPKIKRFDRHGRYISEVFPKRFPMDCVVGQTGTVYIKSVPEGDLEVRTVDLLKLAPGNTELETVVSFPFFYILQGRSGGGMLIGYSRLEYDLAFAAVDADSIVYGFSGHYELIILGAQGKPALRILSDTPPARFSSAEVSQLKKSHFFYKLPEHKPFFYSLLVDSSGRIYAETSGPQKDANAKKAFDVFGRDGRFLYRVVLPHDTCVIKNGFLYAYVVDENAGMEYVKRYQIKNWESLKY